MHPLTWFKTTSLALVLTTIPAAGQKVGGGSGGLVGTVLSATIDAGDVATGTTRPTDGNTIQVLMHDTDCTSLTGFERGELCWERDANLMYVCEPSAGNCDTAGEWLPQVVAGAGDVVGPGLSVDNSIPRFSSTTGKLLQDGWGVTLGDNSVFVLPSLSDPSHATGQLFYSSDSQSLVFRNNESDISLQIGQEEWIRVRNKSGATVLNGKCVYASGIDVGTNLPTIQLARSDTLSTSRVLGCATHDIENNTTGYLTTMGRLNGLDTSAYANGAEVWLDASTAGEITDIRPSQPNFTVPIGTVVRANASFGSIEIRIGGEKFGAFTDTAIAVGGSDGFIKEHVGFTFNDATGVFSLPPEATAPATCSIGDFYVDTSGAACACSSTNTWTNMHGVGTCV